MNVFYHSTTDDKALRDCSRDHTSLFGTQMCTCAIVNFDTRKTIKIGELVEWPKDFLPKITCMHTVQDLRFINFALNYEKNTTHDRARDRDMASIKKYRYKSKQCKTCLVKMSTCSSRSTSPESVFADGTGRDWLHDIWNTYVLPYRTASL